jgi:hypothetical protein
MLFVSMATSASPDEMVFCQMDKSDGLDDMNDAPMIGFVYPDFINDGLIA